MVFEGFIDALNKIQYRIIHYPQSKTLDHPNLRSSISSNHIYSWLIKSLSVTFREKVTLAINCYHVSEMFGGAMLATDVGEKCDRDVGDQLNALKIYQYNEKSR